MQAHCWEETHTVNSAFLNGAAQVARQAKRLPIMGIASGLPCPRDHPCAPGDRTSYTCNSRTLGTRDAELRNRSARKHYVHYVSPLGGCCPPPCEIVCQPTHCINAGPSLRSASNSGHVKFRPTIPSTANFLSVSAR